MGFSTFYIWFLDDWYKVPNVNDAVDKDTTITTFIARFNDF